MSFWELSDQTTANENPQKEYEIPGGNFRPIPDNSDVRARIHDAQWAGKSGEPEKYIEIQWRVQEPEAFANRTVFQKLWVMDLDPKAKKPENKRDKARRMLASIDANAKGILTKSNDTPTSQDLALALIGAEMVVKCMVWDLVDDNGKTVEGNWIAAVKPLGSPVSIGEESATRPPAPAPTKPAGASGGGASNYLDDEIPF